MLATGMRAEFARSCSGPPRPAGRAATPPDGDTIGFLRCRPAMPAEEARWASVPYLYSARTRRDGGSRISEDLERRRSFQSMRTGTATS